MTPEIDLYFFEGTRQIPAGWYWLSFDPAVPIVLEEGGPYTTEGACQEAVDMYKGRIRQC